MKQPLIAKIEINYFRSVYNEKVISDVPLNVIVGGNDSGKSNILRALNLFFNNETDLNLPYNFDSDISRKRLPQTQKSKRKAMMYVKITFNNIFKYSSLPDTFVVKKQWNRYWHEPEITTFPKDIKQNILNRFLNKIQLHYVPAVKSKEIFKYYLELLYDSLANKDVKFSDASKDIVTLVNDSTVYMNKRIQSGIGINSNISIPDDFKKLFGDFDFMTSIGKGEFISLKQRGDGVQVGHIPYILDFISNENDSNYYIWLYEEPENSLEMGKAFQLAEKFSQDFSKNNQIFLTTHSPAFYSLDGEHIKKTLVKKIEDEEGCNVSFLENFSTSNDVDITMGVAALVADRAREIFDKTVALERSLEDTKRELSKVTKPVIFCEGKTDIQYIRKALELFDKNSLLEQCEIIEPNAKKGSGCETMIKIIGNRFDSPRLDKYPALFIFDCDVKGIENKNTDCNTSIYKLAYRKESCIDSGIENLLPIELASYILNCSDFCSIKAHPKQWHKQTEVKEFDKVKICNFVCERSNIEDFKHFEDLIFCIEKFVEKNSA